MGSQEVLSGFLWRARSGIRLDGAPLHAGHGMADPSYRPPRLPYASVVGPLGMELEPDRDQPRAIFLHVQTPGYLAGASRDATHAVPPPGVLALLIDGDVSVSAVVDLGPFAGRALTDPDVGPDIAPIVQGALRAGPFLTGGVPVTDPGRLAELGAITARWDSGARRLVIASGRRGPRAGTTSDAPVRSSVELLDSDSAFAVALGLGVEAVRAPGRLVRHRRPGPSAVAVDVRVDLWAGSQAQLASALDAWARITATRGQLLLRPGLLADDAAPGDSVLRLLSPSGPPTATTLVQLHPIAGVMVDRVSGRPATTSAGAAVLTGSARLSGTARAELRFHERPAIPVAWAAEHPGQRGYAATVGLRLPVGAAGDVVRVLSVPGPGGAALALDVAFVADGPEVVTELRGSADRADGGSFPPVAARIPTAVLDRGAEIHLVVDARRGTTALFVDGDPVGVGPAGPGGLPAGGPGMQVVVGPPSGAGPNPVELTLTHVDVHGAPIGPADPRLRLSASPASAWSPGDPVSVARSEDGVTVVGEPVSASVIEVTGDTLVLDRPLQAAFPRGRTLVYSRSAFFSQRQVRRSDDLMNQLYRMSAEYRVSTFLDEPDAGVSAPLVEATDVEIRDFARLAAERADPGEPHFPGRPARGAPGTRAVLTSFAPRSSTPAATTTPTEA